MAERTTTNPSESAPSHVRRVRARRKVAAPDGTVVRVGELARIFGMAPTRGRYEVPVAALVPRWWRR